MQLPACKGKHPPRHERMPRLLQEDAEVLRKVLHTRRMPSVEGVSHGGEGRWSYASEGGKEGGKVGSAGRELPRRSVLAVAAARTGILLTTFENSK